MKKTTWNRRAAMTAMAALVASMSIGAAIAGAEPGKGKGKSEAAATEASVQTTADAKAEAKTGTNGQTAADAANTQAKSGTSAQTSADAKAKSEAGGSASVTADVYGSANANHGGGRTHGVDNAASHKKEGSPAAAILADILIDREAAQAAAQKARALEAKGELQAAIEAQQEAAVLDPTDSKLVKKLAKLLGKAGDTSLKAFVNGKQPEFDVSPFAKNGRTLVPFRAIAAALQADVSFDAATRTVTVVRGGTTVELTLGDDTAYVNGAAVKLDVAAEAVKGRTVIPLRFLGEAFGADVQFDAETQSVIITEVPTE